MSKSIPILDEPAAPPVKIGKLIAQVPIPSYNRDTGTWHQNTCDSRALPEGYGG